jgi:hypothetical protein
MTQDHIWANPPSSKKVNRFIVGRTSPTFVLSETSDHNKVGIELTEQEYREYTEMMVVYVRWQRRLSETYGL